MDIAMTKITANRPLVRTAVAAVGFALLATGASAESAGKAEYDSNCAVCHGEAGAGSGPMTDWLTISVPKLTGLATANDGVFPMQEVIAVIDGRTGVRGHGGENMPVWGTAFKAEAEDTSGGYGAEIEARGRILSLALYLESIQE
jgi:mono/diheme cytochrome c family protein